MTIAGWIIFGIIAIGILGGATAIAMVCKSEKRKGDSVIVWIVAISIAAIMCFGVYKGMSTYYKNTESGKRALKSQKSNFDSGIERIVTIYDVNGEVIKQYEGKFDVEYDDDRILFDDEKGKRHVVYYTTGTVAIDEK